jgi:hypothetical protein
VKGRGRGEFREGDKEEGRKGGVEDLSGCLHGGGRRGSGGGTRGRGRLEGVVGRFWGRLIHRLSLDRSGRSRGGYEGRRGDGGGFRRGKESRLVQLDEARVGMEGLEILLKRIERGMRHSW